MLLDYIVIVINLCIICLFSFCFSEYCVSKHQDCLSLCNNTNKGGQVNTRYDVCPLRHICQCFTCPAFDSKCCEQHCEARGKVPVVGTKSHTGCKSCECQCKTMICSEKCKGLPYKIERTKYGCVECQCFCPHLDCDVRCGGAGLGIPGPKEETGCYTNCTGCLSSRGKLM